jgi:hypothetical protein
MFEVCFKTSMILKTRLINKKNHANEYEYNTQIHFINFDKQTIIFPILNFL